MCPVPRSPDPACPAPAREALRRSRARPSGSARSSRRGAWPRPPGCCPSASRGGADPSSGASLLLPAFAAAFLGATSVVPGRFNPWGSLIAVYFLATGVTGLQILGAEGFVQRLFCGGALIVAVALTRLARTRTATEDP